jgi:large subunit ribosomal protein L32e
MAIALKIKKKAKPIFSIPNYGTKSRSRVPSRWRKQRGIDNKKRVKKNFAGAEPTIGYGNPEAMRGIRATGRRLIVVANMKELHAVLALPGAAEKYDVAASHAIARRKRVLMTEAAARANMRLVNGIVAKAAAAPGQQKGAGKPAERKEAGNGDNKIIKDAKGTENTAGAMK